MPKRMAYLSNSVEEGTQANFLRSGFQNWARDDPGEAVKWLDQMPETLSDERSADIYSSVAHAYVQHDPMVASEWIAGLAIRKSHPSYRC